MRRLVYPFVFVGALLAVSALALADAPAPAQFELVERYATLLSDGRFHAVVELFQANAVLVEHDLFWQLRQGQALHERLRELVDGGVRVAVELAWASDDGALLVTNERMWWAETSAERLPLRSTATYLVDGERLLSVTRVLVTDQRDVLKREAVVGRWAIAQYLARFAPDGSFRIALRPADLDHAPLDSGTWTITGGVVTIVSDEATSICRRGDIATWHVHFHGVDAFDLVLIDETCPHGRRGRYPGYTRTYVRVED